MTWMDWYDALDKPIWTPEPSTISQIWQLLHLIILVTFEDVFYLVAPQTDSVVRLGPPQQ